MASVSHFFMKLAFAAPASFLSLTVAVHEEPSARTSDGRAADVMRPRVIASTSVFT